MFLFNCWKLSLGCEQTKSVKNHLTYWTSNPILTLNRCVTKAPIGKHSTTPTTRSVADLEIEWDGCYPAAQFGRRTRFREKTINCSNWLVSFNISDSWNWHKQALHHSCRLCRIIQITKGWSRPSHNVSSVAIQMDIWALVRPCPSVGDSESLTVHKLIIYAVRVLPETRLPHGFGCLTNRSFPLVWPFVQIHQGIKLGTQYVEEMDNDEKDLYLIQNRIENKTVEYIEDRRYRNTKAQCFNCISI